MTDAALVRVERRGPVGVVTLDDPRRRNILTSPMVRQLGAAVDELEADPDVRALVVTGAGPAFCAGAELATLERASEGDFGLVREVYTGFLRVLHSPLLTIAAVNGPAVGAGLNLALACDLRLAGDAARFVCRFAELKLFPGGGHTWMLTRAVGHQAAVRGVLLGQVWDAEAARADGLAAEVVPGAQLVDRAVEMAAPLADQDREYTRRLVEVLRLAPSMPTHAEALELEAAHQEWSTQQPAFLAGLAEIQARLGTRS